jgi:hypothetical protein
MCGTVEIHGLPKSIQAQLTKQQQQSKKTKNGMT